MTASSRTAEVTRTTTETDITANINIDGTGICDIGTGIGFFDHMLQALCRHAAMDVTLKAAGDLHVDAHHTIEDTGIVLGTAVHRAVGGRYEGLVRFGAAHVPMDEALVRLAVDLCNRPYLVWEIDFDTQMVGGVDTQLFREFFQAFAVNARICINVSKLSGINTHHIAESCFKGLGRALRQSLQRDPVLGHSSVSTKGVI